MDTKDKSKIYTTIAIGVPVERRDQLRRLVRQTALELKVNQADMLHDALTMYRKAKGLKALRRKK